MLLVRVALNIVLGLGLEALAARQNWPLVEPLVGVITLAHLGALLLWPPRVGGAAVERRTLLLCLALATAGELLLSLGLGLYRYRLGGLPLFVPPGHVLLFVAGLRLERAPAARRLPALVLALAVPVLGLELWCGRDVLSVPLLLLFALCLRFGPAPRLYAVMFLLALALELLGTGLGAWTWATQPALHLRSANPPLAAGVFYAVLDLLTLALTRLLARQPVAAATTAST